MAKPSGRNPGGRVSGRLLSTGAKGTTRTGVRAAKSMPRQIDMLNPSKSGNPDVVDQRTNETLKGGMLRRVLIKSKSTGLGALGSVKANPKGSKGQQN